MNDSLVVIGNFDGLHRGHQAVLSTVSHTADARGLTPRLMTFHPHPAITLGRAAPALLTTVERKLELARRVCPGIEPALIEFTTEFANQSPEQFAANILTRDLHAKVVMVGDNFRFGKHRAGDLNELTRLGQAQGFEVEATELLRDDAGPFSSTRARQLIKAGHVAEAATILGRPHMVSGTVSHGDKRGRTLGFPTMNIVDAKQALPAHGVYAILIDQIMGTAVKAIARGVANLGVRPTIGDGLIGVLEAHAFDFDQEVYGAQVRVHFISRLRAEKKFDSLDALKAQIAADSAAAEVATVNISPAPAADGAWH